MSASSAVRKLSTSWNAHHRSKREEREHAIVELLAKGPRTSEGVRAGLEELGLNPPKLWSIHDILVGLEDEGRAKHEQLPTVSVGQGAYLWFLPGVPLDQRRAAVEEFTRAQNGARP